jgi:hypothetical protein
MGDVWFVHGLTELFLTARAFNFQRCTANLSAAFRYESGHFLVPGKNPAVQVDFWVDSHRRKRVSSSLKRVSLKKS